MNFKKIYILSSFILYAAINVFAGGGPDPCNIPFTPCWCLTHPNEEPCIQLGIPINNGLWLLLIAGLILGVYFIKKRASTNLQ